MFNAFLSPRAASATPEERVGASTEHLPDACGLRPSSEGLGLLTCFSGLHLSSLRAAARGFAVRDLPTADIRVPLLLDTSRRHAGNRATLSLSAS